MVEAIAEVVVKAKEDADNILLVFNSEARAEVVVKSVT